ncbi:MAG TPA: hypothetical protein VKX25_10030 [Bryobacteraceae bacterium]|jgi:hypothetical protein|nr:hypothetical protein [Bryobacteraceae bacterium]
MACPFFEPREVVSRPEYPGARLPLLEEYDGLCHATSEPLPAPAELRFRCCNHGYSSGCCPHLPVAQSGSAVRFDVLSRTPETITLLYVQEHDHTPLRWRNFCYSIAAQRFDSEFADECAEAQARAFCASFLRRFAV